MRMFAIVIHWSRVGRILRGRGGGMGRVQI